MTRRSPAILILPLLLAACGGGAEQATAPVDNGVGGEELPVDAPVEGRTDQLTAIDAAANDVAPAALAPDTGVENAAAGNSTAEGNATAE
jgi:hypothetical protein